MHHAKLDMTWEALSCRADEVLRRGCVADYLGGDDLRTVTLFLKHEYAGTNISDEYVNWPRLEGKEVLGVALVDDDDDRAPIEILTRDEAYDRFGWKLVSGWEEVG